MTLFEDEFLFIGSLCYADNSSLCYFAVDYTLADAILNIGLDGTLQRTGTKLHVIALGGHEFLGLVAQLDGVAEVADALEESLQLNVDDALDGAQVELVEGDDLVETVEELGRELF